MGPSRWDPQAIAPCTSASPSPTFLPAPQRMRTKYLPPPLRMPPLHDKQAWSQYHRAIDRARRIQPDPTDLLTAMRTAAVACGFQQHPHTDWAPEAEWGRAPCDRLGAGPQKPSGAGPRATAEGLGPRSSSKCGAVVLGGGVCCDYSDDCAAPGGPKFFYLDGSVAFFKSGESYPTQPNPHTDDARPPTALGDMLHDLWHAKQQLATLLHTDTPQTRRHIHHCRTQIAHIRADLQRWHIHRQQRIAEEHERYA